MSPRKNPELNSAFAEAVREFAKPTTPDQLEKRGVRTIRSVPVQQISDMIEKAVNRTILERTLGAQTGDLGVLVEQAQSGLLGLLKGVEEVEASRGAISRSRTELLDELAEMRRVRATPTPPADPNDPTVQKMRVAIKDLFAQLGQTSQEALVVERQFTEQALVLMEEMRRRTAAAQIRESDAHVDRLERRVRKLAESLEVTEQALKAVAAMKNVDLGIASLYRVVQGLPTEEANRALKQEMMQIIFNANLDFQKNRAAPTP